MQHDGDTARSGRDATATKAALVRAARLRFAFEGFRGTTARQISGDVGVNVSLINRYFGSKHGLFEACMTRISEEMDQRSPTQAGDFDSLIARLIDNTVADEDDEGTLQLLLLLRSSGDVSADRVRQTALEHFTHRLAAAAGWRAEDALTTPILLHAQLVIATMLGVVLLRTSTPALPIATAADTDLAAPLGAVFRLLLTRTTD